MLKRASSQPPETAISYQVHPCSETSINAQSFEQLNSSNQNTFYKRVFLESEAIELLIERPTKTIIKANFAASKFYGYTIEYLQSLAMADLEDSPSQMEHESHFFSRHRLASGELREVEIFLGRLDLENRQIDCYIIHDITEARQAELILREREQRLHALLNVVTHQEAILMMETDGTVFIINPAGAKWLNKSIDELIGHRLWDVFPLTDSSDIQRIVEEVINTKEARTLFDKHAGHYFYINIYPVLDEEEHKVIRIALFARDMTERKLVQDALQKSERKYCQLYESLQDAIVVTNIQGLILEFNPSFQTMLGYDAEEIYTLTTQDITPTKWHPIEARILTEQVLTQGYSEVYEKEYLRKNGSLLPIETRTYLMTNEQGEPTGLWGLSRDITERKWAQENLRLANAYNRSLIEASLDSLITITPQGKINDLNAATEVVTGYSREELFGKNFSDYFTEPQQAQSVIQQALRLGVVYDYELALCHKDGHVTPVLCNLSIYGNEVGQIMGIIMAARNITQHKQVEMELRHAKETAEVANRAKSAFLANMSHELRTPLNAILGYTQILSRDRNLTDKQQENISIIHRSGEYLLTLISDILDLSKIESGHLELHPAHFDFSEFLEGINDLFRLRAHQKNIKYIYQPISPIPMSVCADEKRLRQVLINLLSNAIKFTQKGEVSLKLTQSNGKILFQVEDTGIGISIEDQQKIFLPFQQVGDPRYYIEGTGLGLSITKKLVELMGSELHVESIIGEGSVFWMMLDLPLSKVTKKVKVPQLPKIIGFQGPQKRILVVDDKKENRMLLIDFLTPIGFEVIEADNGKKGLEKAKQLRPHLIVMDLLMPEMDGFEAIRQIRNTEEIKHIPIIAASASIFEYHQQKSFQAGCNDFVTKPIQMDIFTLCIQKHLGLIWNYEETSHNKSLVTNDVPEEDLVAPTLEQVASLYELMFTEELSKVVEQANKFSEFEPQLIPFAKKIAHLAKEFREDEICKLLEYYLKP